MAVTVAGARSNQRRQKQIVVVGGVLLVILLFIQVPKLMNGTGGGEDTSTPAPTAPASTAAAAPPAAGTAAPATPSATGAPAPVAPAAPPVASGTAPAPSTSAKFVSLGRFRSKDPFVSQVREPSPSGGPAAPSAAPAAPAASPGPTTAAAPSQPSAPAPAAAAAKPTAFAPSPAKAARTATIAVNGAEQQIDVGGSFPKSDPVFRLVSVTTSSAKVAIVDGKLKDGAGSVTLQQGVPLTLMNTADRKRYVLRLVSAR